MPLTGDAKRDYQRKWIAKRRADFMEDKSCEHCGATENLELDHIDQTTKISHSIWSWSEPRRLAEIAKCQILCNDCHKIKTKESRDFSFGERVGSAKLTDAIVLDIRAEWDGGTWRSMSEIARHFGVSQKTISNVVRRNSWVHI